MHNSSSTRPTFTFDAPVPVRNLGVRLAIDPHLSFSSHISNLSRSCFMHIRDLRRIRPMLDFKAASTIATSIVHSKLDYGLLQLPLSQSRLLPNTASAAYPKLTCTGCYQNAQA